MVEPVRWRLRIATVGPALFEVGGAPSGISDAQERCCFNAGSFKKLCWSPKINCWHYKWAVVETSISKDMVVPVAGR